MPKVSVIIPVYNCEQYIAKCLDSVINQTLADIEIICVEDCSTDDTRSLLEKYINIDERIKISYNDKNMGQAFSRNQGLRKAQGEYIQFLDADDYLYGEYALEKLYLAAVGNRLDLLKNEWVMFEKNIEKKQPLYPKHVIGKIYDGKELLYNLEYHNICAWITFSNFVRRDFLIQNKIYFYDGIVYEDVLFSYELYYYAKKAMCVDLTTYYYLKHDNSTTTKRKNTNHLRGYLICIDEILKRNFLNSTIEFRYATIKYFLRMYNNVSCIRKKLDCNIETSLFNDEIKRLYEMFWEKSYVNIKIVVQNISMMKKNEKLYLYGAGRAAQELLGILAENDISIDGVFVTNIKNSAKTILGHKVLGIDTYVQSDKSTMFLVAITKKYVGNTIELLRSKGIENIIYVC